MVLQQPTKPALLTPQQIKRDLNRKPPSVTGSGASTSTHLIRTKQQALAHILLHKELQGIFKLVSGSDKPGQKSEVEKELAQVEAALVKAAVGMVEEGAQEEDEGKGVGFRMEEALEDEEEEEEEEEDERKKKNIKERYFALLSKHKVLPATIPIPPSTSTTTTTTTSSSSSSDESDHQAMRDIERDSLVVNGVPYQPGNVGGYQQVLTWLKEVMKEQLQAVKPSPPPPQSSTTASKKSKKEELHHQQQEDLLLETFTKAILKQVNRTNSAGIAFDILTQRLGVENVTTVVPDSKAAEPLLVDVDVGVFPLPLSSPLSSTAAAGGGGGWGWGLRTKVRAATSYVIYDEPCEEQWVSARAEYKETMCLPLLGGQGGGGGGGRGGRGKYFSLGASVVLTEKK